MSIIGLAFGAGIGSVVFWYTGSAGYLVSLSFAGLLAGLFIDAGDEE